MRKNKKENPFGAGVLFDFWDEIRRLFFLLTLYAVADIINKSIVLHDKYDDFSTQPSGNSGYKIACGKIIPYNY